MADELLRIAHLSRHFGKNKAVEDVSLQIFKGEVLGLVGESGSGKTTTGRCIMGLYPLSAGTVFYKNQPIRTAGRKTVAMRRAAKNTPAPRIQMIFQDPMASLDPRMTVRESIAEGCREKFDLAFAKWILYKSRTKESRARYRRVLTEYADKTTVIQNQRELSRFIKEREL